jgi:7-cyano-7-deazaguanine synthase
MKPKAIVLLSGGLDSTTCLAMAKYKNLACYCLSFNYGQRSTAELNAATKISKNYDAHEHRIVNLTDIGKFGGSALTDHSIDLKTDNHDSSIPSSYVPARNTIFLSIAMGWAEAIGAQYIYIGVNKDDYNNYPDCRQVFIDKFQQLADVATKQGLEQNPITVVAPLLSLTKEDIIAAGTKLNIDYSQTVTCYGATSEGLACGICLSCTIRKDSFNKAQVTDPTRYITSESAA